MNSPSILRDIISLKIRLPKEVTEEGIVISDNRGHSLKIQSPIFVTEEGIVICVNDEHS